MEPKIVTRFKNNNWIIEREKMADGSINAYVRRPGSQKSMFLCNYKLEAENEVEVAV